MTVDGMPVGTITAIGGPSDAVMSVSGTVPGSGGTVAVSTTTNPVRVGGNDITVTGGGGPGPTLTPPTFSGTLTAGTNTLTRSTGSWITDGFVYGMVLQIGGVPGWTVAGVTDSTLLLSGAALTPGTTTISTSVPIIGWAPSPLVVYGGTSQDGIWYSGDPHTLSQRDFGTKPFPTQLGNGTPDFIFPVADPFRFFGNNVLDASADFPIAALPTGTTPNAGVPEGQVPSVGVILYGGPGNNTIHGSQASDFIAGGSGNTTVYGERGRNQILGSDGVNVDVITRAASFPTVNVSVFPDADPLLCGQHACNNLIYGNTPGAGEVVTDRFGDYNNVVFGAMGVVTQDTQEATVGILGATITLSGLTLVSNLATGMATLTCPNGTACFNSGWTTLAVSDQNGYLGAGTTIASVDSSLKFATLSRNALNGASATNLTVTVNTVRSVSGTVTGNPPGAATVANTVPPGTTSAVATFMCATACFNATDVGLDVSDGNVHLSPGTVIVAVSGDLTTATLSRNVKDALPFTGSDAITVGPPHGYCRPAGSTSNSPFCPAGGITAWGDARSEKLQTTGDITAIASAQTQNHGNDTLYGSGGDNVLIGGDGNDNIQGGPGRNLIIGGSVQLYRGAGNVSVDPNTHLFNYTNPRFQDLSGTLMYNTTPSNSSAFGQAQNDGTPQCDPTGHAWWSDFLSNAGNPGTVGTPSCSAGPGAIGITLSAPVGTPGWPVFLQDSPYKGADYIAGGSGSGYIFGESNNNVIQAHGSIDITYPYAAQPATGSETSGDPYAGAATCPFAGFMLGNRVGACRTFAGDALPVDPTLPLQVNPSVDNFGPKYSATGTYAFGANTITRSGVLSWSDFGFAVGQTITVNGAPAGVITAQTFSVITVSGTFVAGSSAATIVATDGETYVEGGRGNNTIFANQGQNDIAGGSSDLFSLNQPALRASGSNLIFGGSGNNVGYGDCTNAAFDSLNSNQECVTSANAHAHDANVITSNNADVFRLVGTKKTYGAGNGVPTFNFTPGGGQPAGAYLNYNYDLAGYPSATERIIARAVTVLDDTPGGPDLAGEASSGPLVTGAKANNGTGDIGGNPVPGNWANSGQPAGTLQQGSEIHAESGDAFIYGGPADDMIFGGAQNDTIVLGYGDNWVSGGRGDQCIIGGGGRCLVSRNGSSEPLYGIAAIPSSSSTTSYLNQLITTPGNVQQATINVSGALNYTPLLYPYNWDPNTYAAPGVSNGNPTYSTNCKENQTCPTYETVYGHNIIYGGWGNGVVHGGPGNSAISGAEAPTRGFADNFNMFGTGPNANESYYLKNGVADTVLTDYVINSAPIQTDFFHPFNPGNAAGFMPNSDPPNGNQGRGYNIGKSLYFNAEDVRRQIELFPAVVDPNHAADGLMPATGFNPLDCEWTGAIGSTCADSTAAGLPFFLTFNQVDPNLPVDAKWNVPAGYQPDPVTGDKALFGDLGNDYLVAGMGRVRVYGGWGFDLIDLRASTVVDGGLNDMPVPNAHGGAGSPDWESLAYGGAGQDIFFAGTGGDRLIDWVGNHNSFYVPFSQFGMPAVSRTLMPFLPEFLYALSKSDGADQTLGPRANLFCSANPSVGACVDYPTYSGSAARNGEPFGELGLVLQHDAAWHQQSGPPFNEMPENLGGVGVDVQKTANVLPFASPGTCDYLSEQCPDPPALSLPNGAGANLPSGTNTPGAGAVPLTVTGTPGSTVGYTATEGTNSVSGSGVVGATGAFGTSLNVSAFPDGAITVTASLTLNGTTTTLTGTMGKNSVAPPAPAVSAAAYANLYNFTLYNVTVTGQAGAIANVVVSDGQVIADQANGMDFVGSSGSVVVPIDLTGLVDGPLTISVTLTNGAGNSYATTLTVNKDTVPPALQVSAPPYINIANVSTYQPVFTGETGATVNYSITDGTTTLTGSKFFNGSGKWQPSMVLTSLQNGPVTLTVTETDPAGNPTVVVTNVIEDTVAPAGSFSIAGTTINGVTATTNPAPALTLAFTVASGIATFALSTDGGSTYGMAQPYATSSSVTLGADGLYTIAVQVTSNAGNVATFAKQVRLDRTGPAISYSISAPTNAGSYDVGQMVTLSYSASDVDNVSSVKAVLDGSTNITSGVAFNTETLAAGSHTIVITAVDGLGNVSTTTTTIQVHATVGGLTTAVNDGVTNELITSSTVANQLLSYLASAAKAIQAGKYSTAQSYLQQFVSLVQQQSGVTINAAYAALLAGWANDLISRL
ncbi:MAG TPA: hypothetical protein VKT20_02055 [Candidatus Dormibacteraeota bacterium]|nr:hypothetical protein [Candidatus Dormibacteraeota bacterium]